MFCPTCGAKIPDVAKFCTKCGRPLPKVATEVQRAKSVKPLPPKPTSETESSSVSPSESVHVGPLATGFLSQSQVQQWRVLSQLRQWEITTEWGDAARKQAATLEPPFVPEHEKIIFDAPVWAGWGGADIRVGEVSFKGKSLTAGFFLATDCRFVFGNTKQKLIFQILYENIKAVYTNRDDYTLTLIDGSKCLLRMKVPHRSLLGTLAIMGPNPVASADIAHREENKEEVAQNFHAIFTGFFTEIVDENRSRRGG